jgi:hypothetical protein
VVGITLEIVGEMLVKSPMGRQNCGGGSMGSDHGSAHDDREPISEVPWQRSEKKGLSRSHPCPNSRASYRAKHKTYRHRSDHLSVLGGQRDDTSNQHRRDDVSDRNSVGRKEYIGAEMMVENLISVKHGKDRSLRQPRDQPVE